MAAEVLAISLLTINAAYWLWYRLCVVSAQSHKKTDHRTLPPVSVVIVYKNAGRKITDLIKSLLAQDYPEFEILAINDYSTDDGPSRLATVRDPRLRMLDATLDAPGKKQALQQGIKHAGYQHILLTDADCMPASANWIRVMASMLIPETKTQIILGYGPLNKSNSLLNDFARFETITTAMQYFSAAVSKIPYMGVGRNMMYTRSLFESIGGFDSHSHVTSGDDDLFVRDSSGGASINVCLTPDSFMYSDAKDTLRGYLSQKSRHISTSVHYRWVHKILLGVLPACHAGFYTVCLTSFLLGWMAAPTFICLVVSRWLVMYALLWKPMSLLDGRDLVIKLPLLDLFYFLYYGILPVFSLFRKKSW